MPQEAEKSNAVSPKFTNKYVHVFTQAPLHLVPWVEHTSPVCDLWHRPRCTQTRPEGRWAAALSEEGSTHLLEGSLFSTF